MRYIAEESRSCQRLDKFVEIDIRSGTKTETLEWKSPSCILIANSSSQKLQSANISLINAPIINPFHLFRSSRFTFLQRSRKKKYLHTPRTIFPIKRGNVLPRYLRLNVLVICVIAGRYFRVIPNFIFQLIDAKSESKYFSRKLGAISFRTRPEFQRTRTSVARREVWLPTRRRGGRGSGGVSRNFPRIVSKPGSSTLSKGV